MNPHASRRQNLNLTQVIDFISVFSEEAPRKRHFSELISEVAMVAQQQSQRTSIWLQICTAYKKLSNSNNVTTRYIDFKQTGGPVRDSPPKQYYLCTQ